MLFCLQPKSSGGTRRSRTEGRALRTNRAQGVLQLQELRTMWFVWRLFWIGLIAEEVGLPKTDVHHPPWNCKHVVPSPRQCAKSHIIRCEGIFAQHNITTLLHPPYSPDLAPCDFFYSPSSKPTSKVIILGQMKTSRQLRRGLWTAS